MTKAKGLFLALPTYGDSRWNLMHIIAGITQQKSFQYVIPQERDISLLAQNFNSLYCEAIKLHMQGIVSHFLLLHADIKPILDNSLPVWVDQFYNVFKEVDAQVMSVVSPIKDSRGVTSTGLDADNLWSPRRLTMTEIMAQEHDTFTHPDLIVNTGMLLIDLQHEWTRKVYFTIKDMIRWTAATEDTPSYPFPVVQPEDWDFSRQVRALGVQLWATRRVRLLHRGVFDYPNYHAWGTQKQDEGDRASYVKINANANVQEL